MVELVRAENELSDWFPEQMDRSRKDLLNHVWKNFRRDRGQFCMTSKPFVAYNFGKNRDKNNIMKIVCSLLLSL